MNITLDDHDEWEQADMTLAFEANETSQWITVKLGEGRPDATVLIKRTDEGLVVDVYPVNRELDEPLGSTYVFDAELGPEWADAEDAGECARCHRPLRYANGVLIDNTGGDVCEDDLGHELADAGLEEDLRIIRKFNDDE